MVKILEFPKKFLWGTAASAYQIEGGIKNNWTKFAQMSDKRSFDAGLACDHYHHFQKDFDLIKNLCNNAYRFSIEWARVEPQEGFFDEEAIKYYKQILKELKSRNIEPFVTLWHFTLPEWFAENGGWLNKNSPQIFNRYVGKVVQELGTNVNFWLTMNEPLVYVGSSYIKGVWPPQKKNFFQALKIIFNLIKAHRSAYQKIHRAFPAAQVGIAKHIIYFDCFFLNYFWNKYFVDKIKNYQDFIGLNYYFRYNFLGFNKNKKDLSDLGWQIFPKGLYRILKNFKKYKRPIYITENGIADKQDKKRKDFIKNHLFWIYQGIKAGIDVRGYFYWSFLDNFEWDKGFAPRFGLYEVNYQTMERRPRFSARFYRDICYSGKLIYED